jgi:hypothetical protein
MKRRLIRTKKFYLGIIVLIATAGSIFFFPMNIGGKYTCFYHRLFNHEQPVLQVNELDHQQHGGTRILQSGDRKMSDKVSTQNKTETTHHGSVLLDNYLHQYAFPWWVSIGLLAFGIYLFLKIKRKLKRNESSLTVSQ